MSHMLDEASSSSSTSLSEHSSPIMSGSPSSELPVTVVASLKRRASPSFEDVHQATSRKKPKEDQGVGPVASEADAVPTIDGQALASELEQELQCACCSALVYRPVVVMPCQHFFCGSCVVMWIRNGGTSCPACRSISNVVMPSRALQCMVDLLLRAAPHKARAVNERMQADDVYKADVTLRIPSPRQASPEPHLNPRNSNFVHPCPHCAPDNPHNWRCPRPIIDPEINADNAWHADDGSPPGHAYCGNCENILALQAPSTSKCDFCQVSFCGISIPGRCVAIPLLQQHLHGLSDIGDLIQCGEIYECFDSNTVEVDIMIDYLTAQRISPRYIYRDIVAFIQSQPRQFGPLIELDLFTDVHSVSGGVDPGFEAPRHRICRVCASEVFFYGLRDWWVRERRKGYLEDHVMKRPDCPEGSRCNRQKEYAHAKEFNHIIVPSDPLPEVPPRVDRHNIAQGGTRAPLPSSSWEEPSLPPLLDPVPPANLGITLFSQMSADFSGPSSQDFRDEVDRLL